MNEASGGDGCAPAGAPPLGRVIPALPAWLVLTFCAPALGYAAGQGDWYAGLSKPAWNPPGWLFGPVWTTLYALMAVAAWLVWRRGGWRAQRGPLGLYLVQLALNAAWTPLFFGLRWPLAGLVDIVLLLAAVVATLAAFVRVRRWAGLLLVPYLLWVSFATVLNFTLWQLNRG